MFRCRPMVRVRNTAVIGFAGAPPPAGCWATRLTGRARARIAAYESFIRSPRKWQTDEGESLVIVGGVTNLRNGGGRTRRDRPRTEIERGRAVRRRGRPAPGGRGTCRAARIGRARLPNDRKRRTGGAVFARRRGARPSAGSGATSRVAVGARPGFPFDRASRRRRAS